MRDLSSAARDCPLAPPEHASVYARTLHRACLVIGGIQPLAKRLGASEADLHRWLLGDEKPPEQVFLTSVEIVLLHAGSTGRAN
jgi:hypothetical protein